MNGFKLLNIAELVVYWPKIRPLLERAVAKGRGEVTVDDILDLAAKGRMSVSVVWENGEIVLAFAAELMNFPRRKILNLAFAGGKHGKPIADTFDENIGKMASELGADAVQCFCDPVVERFLRRVQPSAEQAYIVMERKVAA